MKWKQLLRDVLILEIFCLLCLGTAQGEAPEENTNSFSEDSIELQVHEDIESITDTDPVDLQTDSELTDNAEPENSGEKITETGSVDDETDTASSEDTPTEDTPTEEMPDSKDSDFQTDTDPSIPEESAPERDIEPEAEESSGYFTIEIHDPWTQENNIIKVPYSNEDSQITFRWAYSGNAQRYAVQLAKETNPDRKMLIDVTTQPTTVLRAGNVSDGVMILELTAVGEYAEEASESFRFQLISMNTDPENGMLASEIQEPEDTSLSQSQHKESVSVVFQPDNENQKINDINATISQLIQINGCDPECVERVGMRLYDSRGNEQGVWFTESPAWEESMLRITCDINKQMGCILIPGGKYQYRFELWTDDSEYTSTMYAFSAAGSAPAYFGSDLYAVLSTNNGLALTAAPEKTLTTEEFNGTAGQIWHLRRNSDSSYLIYSCAVSGYVLEAGRNNDGVSLSPSHANISQKWYIIHNGNGYTLQPESGDGKVLQFGSRVYLNTKDGSESQSLKIDRYTFASGISLNETRITMEAGSDQAFKLEANIQPENAANNPLIWSSSHNEIASVDQNGYVSALSAGITVITAMCPDGSETHANVTVIVQDTDSILQIDYPDSIELGLGEELTPHVSWYPENVENTISFESDDPGIVEVHPQTGTLTATGLGTAVITVRADSGVYTNCSVTVRKAPTSVRFASGTLQIGLGDAMRPRVILPADSASQIRLTTDNTEILCVRDDGSVQALSTGTARLTVTTFNGRSAAAPVIVTEAPESVSFAKKSIMLGTDQTAIPGIRITPENTVGSYTLASSDESVFTIEDDHIRALAVGTATLTATLYNGAKAHCTVVVLKGATSVVLRSSKITLGVRETNVLKPVIDGSLTPSFTFVSSDPSVAEIDKNGVITGRKVGTAIITVETYNGKTTECTVTVCKAPSSIRLSEKEIVLVSDESVILTAELGEGEAGKLTWASSNSNIAVVDGNGRIVSKGPGQTIITVTSYNGKSAKCKVIVQ